MGEDLQSFGISNNTTCNAASVFCNGPPKPKVYETERSLLHESSDRKERPSSSAWQSEGFVNFLLSQQKTAWTIKQTKNYAIRFGHVLDTGDASPLLELSPRNKQHALAALANLAKYQGRYGHFVQIRQNYALKWTAGNNSLQTLQRFFDPDLTLEVMIQKIRQMISLLPPL